MRMEQPQPRADTQTAGSSTPNSSELSTCRASTTSRRGGPQCRAAHWDSRKISSTRRESGRRALTAQSWNTYRANPASRSVGSRTGRSRRGRGTGDRVGTGLGVARSVGAVSESVMRRLAAGAGPSGGPGIGAQDALDRSTMVFRSKFSSTWAVHRCARPGSRVRQSASLPWSPPAPCRRPAGPEVGELAAEDLRTPPTRGTDHRTPVAIASMVTRAEGLLPVRRQHDRVGRMQDAEHVAPGGQPHHAVGLGRLDPGLVGPLLVVARSPNIQLAVVGPAVELAHASSRVCRPLASEIGRSRDHVAVLRQAQLGPPRCARPCRRKGYSAALDAVVDDGDPVGVDPRRDPLVLDELRHRDELGRRPPGHLDAGERQVRASWTTSGTRHSREAETPQTNCSARLSHSTSGRVGMAARRRAGASSGRAVATGWCRRRDAPGPGSTVIDFQSSYELPVSRYCALIVCPRACSSRDTWNVLCSTPNRPGASSPRFTRMRITTPRLTQGRLRPGRLRSAAERQVQAGPMAMPAISRSKRARAGSSCGARRAARRGRSPSCA